MQESARRSPWAASSSSARERLDARSDAETRPRGLERVVWKCLEDPGPKRRDDPGRPQCLPRSVITGIALVAPGKKPRRLAAPARPPDPRGSASFRSTASGIRRADPPNRRARARGPRASTSADGSSCQRRLIAGNRAVVVPGYSRPSASRTCVARSPGPARALAPGGNRPRRPARARRSTPASSR